MKTIGTAKRGYPVYEKTTLFGPDGKETYSILSEVVELSKATLESALFEIPADYREVSDSAELYASMSNPASGSQGSTGTASSSMKLPNAGSTSAGASNTSGDSAAIGPKKAGTIRIGIAGVKTGAVGEGITSADLAAAVQNTLIQYLKVPNLEVVTLDAKLPSAAESEARVKECDFIIAATVSHKKGGGGFGGMLGQTLGSAVGRVGIGHTGSTIGNIAGQVATQSIVSATSVSASIKSKDEVTVDLRLNKIDGGQAFAKVYKAKAKSSGEDIISQIIEQAAQAVVDTVGR